MRVGRTCVIFGWWCSHPQGNPFGPHHLHPSPSELTPGPISPKDRGTRGRFRHLWGRLGCCLKRWRGTRLMSCDRPENRTDPSGFGGEQAFLTLGTQITDTTIANASSIQKTIGAIPLWSAFLRIKGAVGRTTQRPIRLKRKCGSWKAISKRGACPLRGTILDNRRRFFSVSRFFAAGGLDCWSEFGQPHSSG